MPKEIPILFSTEMVNAIMEGRKVMTRRVVKHKISFEANDSNRKDLDAFGVLDKKGNLIEIEDGEPATLKNGFCPYGRIGDILWVRESFRNVTALDGDMNILPASYPVQYKADFKQIIKGHDKFKPSIHMPKKEARIWLEVTSIAVERVQDITEEDAIAEGVQFYQEYKQSPRYKDYMADASEYGHPDHDYPTVGLAVTSFATLWEKINGVESWAANPWVWVVSFKVLSTTGRPEVK